MTPLVCLTLLCGLVAAANGQGYSYYENTVGINVGANKVAKGNPAAVKNCENRCTISCGCEGFNYRKVAVGAVTKCTLLYNVSPTKRTPETQATDFYKPKTSYEFEAVYAIRDCFNYEFPRTLKKANSRAYWVNKEKLQWLEASYLCQLQGGNLANILPGDSLRIQDLLEKCYPVAGNVQNEYTTFWTSLKRTTPGGSTFVWQTGAVPFIEPTNWYPGYPGTLYDCGVIYNVVLNSASVGANGFKGKFGLEKCLNPRIKTNPSLCVRAAPTPCT